MLSPQSCLRQAGLNSQAYAVQPCPQGLSHQNFQLIANEASLFLRLYQAADRPWLNITHELVQLQAASNIGLAPELVYADPNEKFFLTQFVAHSRQKTYSAAEIFKLVEAFQQLPVTRPMVLSERYRLYLDYACRAQPELTQAKAFLTLKRQMELALACLERAPVGKAYIDWHCYNLLPSQEKLYLIDYEYACITPLAVELASLQLSELLSDQEWPEFRARFEALHQVTISDRELKAGQLVMLAFCYLWYPANGQSDEQEQSRLFQQALQIKLD